MNKKNLKYRNKKYTYVNEQELQETKKLGRSLKLWNIEKLTAHSNAYPITNGKTSNKFLVFI